MNHRKGTSAAVTGPDAERLKRHATNAAVAVALGLIGLKLWAWIVTGSTAMLASLVDSTLDLVASGLNLLAVRHALTPADEEHRFGHGKAEALAGLGQAAFIGGSAAFLFFEAIDRLFVPRPVVETQFGLLVMLVSIAATIALVAFQRYVTARTRSLAIAADQYHYASDIYTNIGVIGALVIVEWSGWNLADPIVAIGLVAIIAWGSYRIFQGSWQELMDRELDDAERRRIKAIVLAHKEVVSLHDLRTRRSGHTAFIQLHIELPPDMTLAVAHRISDEVEEEIRKAFPDAEVLTHQDPAGFEMMKPLDHK